MPGRPAGSKWEVTCREVAKVTEAYLGHHGRPPLAPGPKGV